MPGHLYRLKLRAGEPVSLARWPRTTFLDLPREVRDEVYYDSLCSTKPIPLYESSQDTNSVSLPPDAPSPIAGLATGLFYTNRTISHEAREAFYRHNTFRIAKPQKNWARLWTFLRTIGDVNRSHVRNLLVHAPHYEIAYETSDGTLYQYAFDPNDHKHESSYYQIVAPDTRPALNTAITGRFIGTADGERSVEIFEPAARACFRLLGKVGPRMTMVLKMDHGGGLPGFELHSEKQREAFAQDPHGDGDGDGLDWPSTTFVPEMLRRFAEEETAGRVELLWETGCEAEAFADRRAEMERVGWEVVGVRELQCDHAGYAPLRVPPTRRLETALTMRWVGEDRPRV